MGMTCFEFEILLCDYVDGTLDAERKSALEQHRAECAECEAMARDVAGVVGFIERAAVIEPPPELVTRILFETPQGKPGASERMAGLRNTLAGWFKPVLQPKFAMGMAMTILSFSMLGQFAGVNVRQLRPADLDPVKVWAAVDDQVHRTWQRAVKYYENLRLVYEIQSRLKEWTEEEEEAQRSAPAGQGKTSGNDNGSTQGR